MAANTTARNGVMNQEISHVARFYENKSIFITGATGFMGKVLVEKLLSSCPGIQHIYILMRGKKNVSPDKRLEQLKQIPVFDYLRKYYPQRLDKLIAIPGDILEPDLGISQENQKILFSNVSVVFHSAATVKFDEVLRLSVTMNMLATKTILNLSKKMTKLEAFVHMSTAYCNCDKEIVEEKIYPPPGEVSKILNCLDCLDDKLLDEMTPRLIGNRPNTYTFTKAMAESIVNEEQMSVPVVIIRPSIVTAAHKSPMPGWIDNLNGPTGIIAGAGKGILRTAFCMKSLRADFIPVDICINAVIVSAWVAVRERSLGIKIYNVTSGVNNPLRWADFEQHIKALTVVNPFDDVMWYPGGSLKSSKFLNSICITLFHMIPAYLIDFSYKMFGKKPVMVRIQERIQKMVNALEYFVSHEWTFVNKNIYELQSKMSESDQKIFNVDIKKVNWHDYTEDYIKGIRKFILKEEDTNIPKAKEHLQKMFIVDCFTKALLFLTLIKLMTDFDVVRKFSYTFISYTLQLIRKFSELK